MRPDLKASIAKFNEHMSLFFKRILNDLSIQDRESAHQIRINLAHISINTLSNADKRLVGIFYENLLRFHLQGFKKAYEDSHRHLDPVEKRIKFRTQENFFPLMSHTFAYEWQGKINSKTHQDIKEIVNEAKSYATINPKIKTLCQEVENWDTESALALKNTAIIDESNMDIEEEVKEEQPIHIDYQYLDPYQYLQNATETERVTALYQSAQKLNELVLDVKEKIYLNHADEIAKQFLLLNRFAKFLPWQKKAAESVIVNLNELFNIFDENGWHINNKGAMGLHSNPEKCYSRYTAVVEDHDFKKNVNLLWGSFQFYFQSKANKSQAARKVRPIKDSDDTPNKKAKLAEPTSSAAMPNDDHMMQSSSNSEQQSSGIESIRSQLKNVKQFMANIDLMALSVNDITKIDNKVEHEYLKVIASLHESIKNYHGHDSIKKEIKKLHNQANYNADMCRAAARYNYAANLWEHYLPIDENVIEKLSVTVKFFKDALQIYKEINPKEAALVSIMLADVNKELTEQAAKINVAASQSASSTAPKKR